MMLSPAAGVKPGPLGAPPATAAYTLGWFAGQPETGVMPKESSSANWLKAFFSLYENWRHAAGGSHWVAVQGSVVAQSP